ncbi:MAG: hypothetical protein JO053_02395 [Acidobacteria bacterium]|nr:hypothetical protein [Acidobacteriota bacterium]
MLLAKLFITVTILAASAGAFCGTALGQSSDVNFPTPVRSNEISGVVRARDIGDPRLTQYYYAFDGGQGDIFINVTSKNLTADIDVYVAEGLKPLTKMVIYPESGLSETGRLIYLRKPENLILRVEGRAQGDEAATFQIKFAGSFIAKAGISQGPDKPETVEPLSGAIKVNSVGTILESIPPEVPVSKPAYTGNPRGGSEEGKNEKPVYTPERTKPEVVVSTTVDEPAKVIGPPKKAAGAGAPGLGGSNSGSQPAANTPKKAPVVLEKKADPVANFRLVIVLRDGSSIEHPMPDVLRFAVERGQLIVTTKDGSITRYSMQDVARISVQ